jgi:hypothetical protein
MVKSPVFHCTWLERNETSERIASNLKPGVSAVQPGQHWLIFWAKMSFREIPGQVDIRISDVMAGGGGGPGPGAGPAPDVLVRHLPDSEACTVTISILVCM